MFCSTCGTEVNDNAVICPNCGCQLKKLETTFSGDSKNKWIAIILAIFLGGFGIQWFYLGRVTSGVLSIIFC